MNKKISFLLPFIALLLFCIPVAQCENIGRDLSEQAPIGIGMAALAFIIVAVILIFLFICLKLISKYLNRRDEKNKLESDQLKEQKPELSDELGAAIGLALALYVEDIRNYEEMKLTINKVSRAYNPWSSKIYGVGVLSGKK